MKLHRGDKAGVLAFVLVLLLVPAVATAEEDSDLRGLEVGFLAGSHDNYFFRGGGAEPQSSALWNAYFRGDSERKRKGSKLELFGEVSASEAVDVDNADQVAGVAGVKHKRGRNRVTGELFVRPSQVYFEEGDGVFFDQTGVELGYRRDIKPGMWFGLEAEVEQWRFDPEEAERDADGTELSASLRLPINPRLGVRATVLVEEKDAEAPRFDLSGTGFAIALEAQPNDAVNIFARYKRREREYDNASPGDRNFQREDTVQDIVFNVRWLAAERWGVRLDTFYRDGESSRADRNYDGLRAMAGVFFLF